MIRLGNDFEVAKITTVNLHPSLWTFAVGVERRWWFRTCSCLAYGIDHSASETVDGRVNNCRMVPIGKQSSIVSKKHPLEGVPWTKDYVVRDSSVAGNGVGVSPCSTSGVFVRFAFILAIALSIS